MANVIDRFWRKVNKNGPVVRSELGQCWEWTGLVSNGYGRFSGRRRPGAKIYSVSVGAHRFSLELSLGRPLGPGMYALHECDNTVCVNPAHLSEGTLSRNSQDARDRGRFLCLWCGAHGHRRQTCRSHGCLHPKAVVHPFKRPPRRKRVVICPPRNHS